MNGTERSPAGNSPAAMLDELTELRARRPDIERRAAASVIVTIPGDLACRPIEIAVSHRVWGAVEVDYREDPRHAWVPIRHVGGDFETRP